MRPSREVELQRAVRELARVLRLQLALSRKLLALAQEQTGALVRNDAPRVAELEAGAADLMERITLAEKDRQRAVLALARETGLVAVKGWPSPPMSELLARLPRALAASLIELRARLLETERRLRLVSERNRPLLRNALDFTQVSLDAIARLAVRPNGYGKGARNGGSMTLYLDQSA